MDPTRAALEAMFEGRVGAPYAGDVLKTLLVEARARAEAAIPPGYVDLNKPEADRYGDFLFWRQSVDRARALSVPLIVLTDDEKEDWWWRFHGLTLGPRPELVQEFFDVSGGERLLMYTTLGFIEAANRSDLSQPAVSADAVGEVERLAAERTIEYEARFVDCPYCGSNVGFSIGTRRDYTALPRCQSCGQRFHAFHLSDGGIGTRRWGGAVQDRARVECPACGVSFHTTLPGEGKTKRRACFRCGALLTIDDIGGASHEGRAESFSTLAGDDRCPGCGTELYFVYRTDGEERTSCTECAALVVRAI